MSRPYSPKRPQINLNILQPHPHPPPDHQTGDIEAERHCGQGGQGPGPGGGGHQHDQVQPGGHWLGGPGGQSDVQPTRSKLPMMLSYETLHISKI